MIINYGLDYHGKGGHGLINVVNKFSLEENTRHLSEFVFVLFALEFLGTVCVVIDLKVHYCRSLGSLVNGLREFCLYGK